MKILFFIVLALILFYIISFTVMSIQSRMPHKAGLENGSLKACPITPNCVSSEEKGKTSFIEPIIFTGSPERAIKDLRLSITQLGGKIEKESENYIWATFRTKFWRFTDDAEFVLDRKNSIIRLRSASRVGKGDLGTNRKRIEKLRDVFNKNQFL